MVVEVTVNSKEENSEDYCPNNVLEFGLSNVMFTIGGKLRILYR